MDEEIFMSVFSTGSSIYFRGLSVSKNRSGRQYPGGQPEDVLAAIYETAEVDDYFKEYIKEGLQVTEITAENCSYHLGTEVDFAEAIASSR